MDGAACARRQQLRLELEAASELEKRLEKAQ